MKNWSNIKIFLAWIAVIVLLGIFYYGAVRLFGNAVK
jgi:hypothetical protein